MSNVSLFSNVIQTNKTTTNQIENKVIKYCKIENLINFEHHIHDYTDYRQLILTLLISNWQGNFENFCNKKFMLFEVYTIEYL